VVREHQAAAEGRLIEAVYEGDCAGDWDAERIAQVASNLIGNALKHGHASGPIEVRVDGGTPSEVVLTVANRGSIAPEALHHLFDPFRGGSRPPGRREGLGLGLYIVSQIARAHGGAVDVESGCDDRTAFRVRVPRAAAARAG
jgi:two-component system, sensor histidine kinase and response regulator